MVDDASAIVKELEGICPFGHLKKVTNYLPQLSLITLFTPETAG